MGAWAHSMILYANAPILVEFIDEQDGSEDPVTISGVSWEVFDQVLRFVYTASYPSSQDILHSGKALIEAADKFELISLKLKVEDELVTNRVIDATNAIDYYMFADAKTCPLLKEYAAAFISSHVRDVLNSESVKDLMESNELITERYSFTVSTVLLDCCPHHDHIERL